MEDKRNMNSFLLLYLKPCGNFTYVGPCSLSTSNVAVCHHQKVVDHSVCIPMTTM